MLHIAKLLMISIVGWQFKTNAQRHHLPVHSPILDLESVIQEIFNEIFQKHRVPNICTDETPLCRRLKPRDCDAVIAKVCRGTCRACPQDHEEQWSHFLLPEEYQVPSLLLMELSEKNYKCKNSINRFKEIELVV